jgi:hypothetical protein
MIKPYTVILLRPDYIADPYGQDTYLAWVEADTVRQAVSFAQHRAIDNDFTAESFDGDPDDYFVQGCFEGHLIDLSATLR